MKSLFILTIVILPRLSICQNTNAAPAKDWIFKSPTVDSIPGIGLFKAYDLLKDRQSHPVVVAVLGGGFDRSHEDLKEVTWTNAKEIPSNNIDDDKNGFVDDTWGWNFLADKKGNRVAQLQQDVTYIYKFWKDKYDKADTSKLSAQEQAERKLYEKAKTVWQSKYKYVPPMKTVVQDSARFLAVVAEFAEQSSSRRVATSTFISYKINDDFAEAVRGALLAFFEGLDTIPLGYFLQNTPVRWRTFQREAKLYIMAYDPDYDPLKLVGDHPTDMKEKNYGSSSIVLPEGEDFNHDTHIAGLIGGVRNNGIGIDGIADNVKIMMVVMGAGGDERDKDVANAIRYAVDNGAKVINMSWCKKFSSHKQVVDEAIRYAEEKDVLVVNSAGNKADDCDTVDYYPIARLSDGKVAQNFLKVGCSQIYFDKRLPAVYSNYGTTTVDLFSPGHDSYGPLPGDKYGYAGGTSNAAPIVVGVAALLKSYFPQLSMLEIKNILMETVFRPQLMVIRPHYISPALAPARRASLALQGELVPFSSLSKSGGIVHAEAAVKKALEMVKSRKVN